MRVSVTGASGYVGCEIVKTLLARGHEVQAVDRGTRSASLGDARRISADVTDPSSLQQLFDGQEAVIHLVGIIVESGGATYEKVHAEGTRNVVAAAAQAGVKRFVQMSALGARDGALSRYHQTKWLAEQVVQQSGMAWTIFRPSIIFGQHDAFLNLFATLARFSPILPVIGGGHAKMQPIWVGDVAHCFAAALENPDSAEKAYDLGGPAVYTLKALIQKVVRARCFLPRLLMPLPFPIAQIQARVMEAVLKKPPLTREQLVMLKEDNLCDSHEAADDFNRKWKTLEQYL